MKHVSGCNLRPEPAVGPACHPNFISGSRGSNIMRFSKIYRSTDQKILGGVAAGIADAYGFDPLLIRIAFVGLLVLGGFGIPLYFLLWFLIPADPDLHIYIGPRRSVLPLLLKLLGIIICASLIVDQFDGEYWIGAMVAGTLVGAYFYFRGRDGDDFNERLSGLTSRFYRSRDDRKVMGVFGGLADSFGIDPTLLRIIGAVVMIAAAPISVVAYFLYAFLVPHEREVIII